MTRSNFGHIQYLAPGKYRVHWYENGKQRSRRVTGTRQEAEMVLAAARVGDDQFTVPKTWLEYYEDTVEPTFRDLAANTVSGYKKSWQNELKPRIANAYIQDTEWQFCQDILNQIEAPSAQRKAKALWRKMCNMAVRDNLLLKCPIDRATKLKPRNKRQKTALDASQVHWWLEKIRGIKYEPLLLLEMGGGLSHEEACAMVKENIRRVRKGDRTYALVTVDKALVVVEGKKILKATKNQFRVREVVIGEPFAERLLELTEGEGAACEGWLKIVDGDYSPHNFASPTTITHNWHRWCDNNKVPYVRFGDMRSNYATWHGEAGSPDSVVSMSMGHSDGTTRGENYQMSTRRGLVLIADMLTDYLNGDFEEWDWD